MTLALEKDAIAAALAGLTFRTDAFIDGRFVKAESGKTFSTENPGRGARLSWTSLNATRRTWARP